MILIATDRKFWWAQGGSDHRILSVVHFLHDAGYAVGLFFVGVLSDTDREMISRQVPGLAIYNAAPKQPLVFDARGLPPGADETPAAGTPPSLDGFTDKAVREAFEATVRSVRPSAVIVEYIRLAFLVHGVCSWQERPRLLVDTIDVMSERYASFKRAGIGDTHWVRITPEEEGRALDRFDALLAIQESDASALAELTNGPRVLTVKHAPPLPPLQASTAPERDVMNALFLSGNDPSNVAAARFIIDDVLPLATAPCRLLLAGHVCAEFKEGEVGDNVQLLGPMEALDSLYRQTDIVINPVFAGGGLKIKNVEALSFGKPVITSTAGVIGLEGAQEVGALVACEGTEAFAAAISELAADSDRCAEMGKSARRFSESELSPAVVYSALQSYLSEHSIMAKPRGDSSSRKPPLLLAAGGGQLITQLAAMSGEGIDFDGASVYYLGLQGDLLGPYLAELCAAAGMLFLGELPFRYRAYSPVHLCRLADLCVLLRRGAGYLRHIHEDLNPHISALQGRHLVMSLRHKMRMDPYLVTTLDPTHVTLTADGVVDAVEGWRFGGLASHFFHSAIRQVPSPVTIHAPAYLVADTNRLGAACRIADAQMESALACAAGTPLAKRFLAVLSGEVGNAFGAVIFSQHLALSELCSEEDEVEYYAGIVRDLLARGASSVLIKPHPRDTRQKMPALLAELEDLADCVSVLEEALWGVPVEIARGHFEEHGVSLVTSSSSAPLSIRSDRSRVVCYDGHMLSAEFRAEIGRFAQRHEAELKCI